MFKAIIRQTQFWVDFISGRFPGDYLHVTLKWDWLIAILVIYTPGGIQKTGLTRPVAALTV